MPNFKPVETGSLLLAVDLSCQFFPGTFPHALHYLLDHKIDLSEIEARYRNDDAGASAYEPRVLLKIVLLAYSHGIVSSRKMEWACRNIVQFMAISGDSQPDHSTLATFVSGLKEAAGKVFTQVLLICLRQGLIGREMFAIDGVKLPSNASKARSGKRKDFVRQADKMRKAVELLLAKQGEADAGGTQAELSQREQRRMQRLNREADEIKPGSSSIPRSARARKASCAYRTAPTTSRPRCPLTRAWCKAIPGSRQSTRGTR